ncbi:hypothetical protein [Hymenobacter psychrophilus]|uniref:Uncharacterized protein n=1 Tax=Hymenobacter psychrophilus TaxID=651662 RepID=A0A1H3PKS7_9BACT|nr:hypothetical protein [Hymenobacter psychrophilus]SDZ01802.1 hypothetical protein SAMN04488069_1383 [Hymenobacter psychrophilus]
MSCRCGCPKLENRDLGLCATCNRIRRAGEATAVVKERKPLAQVSAVRSAGLKNRQVAYKEVKAEQKRCVACGTRQRLTPSHVLTQKKFPAHAANPQNIVVLCVNCHDLWENSKAVFRELCPEVWEIKMQIMQALEPAYYQQFKAKHAL